MSTDWDAMFAPSSAGSQSAVENQASAAPEAEPLSKWDVAFAPTPVEPLSAVENNPPPAPERGLFGRSMDRLEEGVGNAASNLYQGEGNPFNEGKETPTIAGPVVDWYSRSLNSGGKIADAVGDVIGDAAGTAYEAIGSPFKEEGTKAIGAVMDSAPVKAAGEVLGAAEDSFPGVAQYIKDATAVASLVNPARSPKVPVKGAESLRVAEKARQAGTRREGIKNLLEPDFDDFKQVTTEGKLKRTKWDPTEFDKSVIDEVNQLPGVKPRASFAENHNVVRDVSLEKAKELAAEVAKKGKPVSASKVYRSIDDSIKQLQNSPVLVGDAGESALRIYNLFKDKVQQAAKANGGEVHPSVLLQIRKDLDKELGIFKKNTQGVSSAREVAGTEIRNKLNSIVADAAPTVPVAKSLEQQWKLNTARDLLHSRMKGEGNNAVTRFIANFERATGFKHPTTPLAGAATIAHLPIAAATLLGAVLYGTGAKIADKSLIALRKAIESPEYALKAAEKAAIISLITQYREDNPPEKQQ